MKAIPQFCNGFLATIFLLLNFGTSAAAEKYIPSLLACAPPSDLQAEVVQSDHASWVYVATITWTGTPGSRYQYSYMDQGSITDETSLSIAGSIENSPLLVSLRTICNDGSSSDWVTTVIEFPPAYCPEPSDVTLESSPTGVTVSFTYPVKEGYGFVYYVLDTTKIHVISSGGSLTPFFVSEGTLKPNTSYVLRLEIYCDPNLSGPVHVLDYPFRTLSYCDTEGACFTLVNADTDEDIQELKDGDVFVKPADMNLNVRYETRDPVTSVKFNHNGDNVRLEKQAPFLLAGNIGDDYLPWTKGVPGEHTIAATPYSGPNATGEAGSILKVSFTIKEEHLFFTVVDADTDEDIQDLRDQDIVYKTEDLNINLRYNPTDAPASVVFKYGWNEMKVDNTPPFAFGDESNGNYEPWPVDPPAHQQLTAIGYSEPDGKGEVTSSVFFTFYIREGCTAEGSILREYWANVSGAAVSDIPVDTEPTTTNYLSIFEGPSNIGSNYATRIRGYVCPPATGKYTFWIASNDQSELWLSSSEDPQDKELIAFLPSGGVPPRAWTVRPSVQQSDPVRLVARKPYYIEALHKQGIKTDNIAVGWQLPDGTFERPIPGYRLSPFDIGPATDTDNVARLSSMNVFPNPSKNGESVLYISREGMERERPEALIEIVNIGGKVVFKERLNWEDAEADLLITLSEPLVPGLYLVKMQADDSIVTQRLLVR